jgi:hypothetical protein
MVYPLIFVMAAIGISWFLEVKKIKKFIPLTTVYAATILLLLASLFFVRPNYLAYASEILPKNFIVNLKGMGEGSFEAANYLNNLPDARNMIIWSDKGAVCEAFVGKCFVDFKREIFRENKIDYFVISTDRKSRSLKMSNPMRKTVDFERIYNEKKYVYNISVANNPNDFVRVIKASDLLNKE